MDIEAAASVGIVSGEGVEHLDDGEVIVVEARRIKQNLILHGGAAEAGIVSNARDTSVSTRNDPVIVGLQFLGGTVRALQDIAIDEAAGTKERGHARSNALGELRIAETLENYLASEIGINAFIKRKAHVGEPIEGDGAHHFQMRRAVHAQFERQSGEALN